MLDKAPNGKVSDLLNALDKALSAGEVDRAVDVDQTGHLTLSLPRLKMFSVNPAGEEVELAPGVIIDTHEHTSMAEILMKRETKTSTRNQS